MGAIMAGKGSCRDTEELRRHDTEELRRHDTGDYYYS
jgi:hypothetical protein